MAEIGNEGDLSESLGHRRSDSGNCGPVGVRSARPMQALPIEVGMQHQNKLNLSAKQRGLAALRKSAQGVRWLGC